MRSRRKDRSVYRLALLLHIFIGATLAGTGVIVALVIGKDTLAPILVAALLGFVLSIPASFLVAKRLSDG
nr:CTP synthetase [Mesobacterium pallidum]